MSNIRQAIGILSQNGSIHAKGADAGQFLQSQLSADILALEQHQSVLTGWHNPKGRVLCCLKVFRAEDSYWLFVPLSMVETTCAGLQRYIFRSKVELTITTAEIIMAGSINDNEIQEIAAPVAELKDRISTLQKDDWAPLSQDQWELAQIQAGLPEVIPETSGRFTGQMLNLDLIGGISFSKGCYPGQEIIARTHHLGRAKRRMHRYVSTHPARQAGEQLQDESGRSAGQVVRSVTTPTGSESLVVATVVPPDSLTSEDNIRLTIADLPYSLQADN